MPTGSGGGRPLGSQNVSLQQEAGTNRLLVSNPGGVAGFTPIQKGRIFNTAVLAATDFFAADLAPSNTPTTFRIYVCLDTAGVFDVQRTSAAVTVAEELNSGGALAADAAYMFDILVHEDDTINLQTSVGAQILYCIVIEVPSVIG